MALIQSSFDRNLNYKTIQSWPSVYRRHQLSTPSEDRIGMRVCLVVMLSLLNAFFLHAFVRTGGRARSKPAVSSTLPDAHLRRVLNLQMNLNKPDVSKAQILMKKKKIQEVQLVKDEIFDGGQEHPVNVFLKTGDRGAQIKNPINFFNHTNVISTGCLSVLSEYNKKTETGFITGMPPPEIMGGVLRDAGSRAIIISMDKRSGGSSCEDFKRFAIEQSRAKMYMPSPLPLVWHDFVVDAVQISQAASLGASAITLYPDFTDSTISTDSTEGEKRERGGGGGGNDLESLVRHAKSLDVEPIGMADSVYNAKIALDAGIRCVCLYLMSEKELVEAREELPDTTSCGQPIMYSGRLRPETDYSSYAEIDSAWVLRDSRFQSVWPSPVALYATGMSDIYTTVLALKSKASRIFLSPRQFLMDRKKEGAQEYLGDILY